MSPSKAEFYLVIALVDTVLSVGIGAAWLLVLTFPTQHIVSQMRSLQEPVDLASVIAAAFCSGADRLLPPSNGNRR
jgi:uncharacterized membrane protein